MSKVSRAFRRVDLTGHPRRVAACMACGEINEIAAHGQCYRCYRRYQREKERRAAGRVVDRHSAAIRNEHTKMSRGFATMMSLFATFRVSEDDALSIRAILEPYMQPIKQYLGGPPALSVINTDGFTDDDDDDDEDDEREDLTTEDANEAEECEQ
jgi:hypothetical protein